MVFNPGMDRFHLFFFFVSSSKLLADSSYWLRQHCTSLIFEKVLDFEGNVDSSALGDYDNEVQENCIKEH